MFEVRLRITAPVTTLAFDERVCAVQLDQAFGTRSGLAVQAINILRNDAAKFAGLLQSNDDLMNGIRPRMAKSISAFQLVIPMLDAGRFRGHEILEVNRLAARPHPLRTA